MKKSGATRRSGRSSTDVHTRSQRSYNMSRIRNRDTKPELKLRKALTALGQRYRLSPRDVPGRPDIVIRKAKLAIFVDGCFWHGCPEHYQPPAANADFWRRKISANMARDKDTAAALKASGWTVLRFWEHEIGSDSAACAEKVERSLRDARPAAKTTAATARKANVRGRPPSP